MTEHIEAICEQNAIGVLHVDQEMARLEGELEVSFCSVNNAYITNDIKGLGETPTASHVVHGVAQTDQVMLSML